MKYWFFVCHQFLNFNIYKSRDFINTFILILGCISQVRSDHRTYGFGAGTSSDECTEKGKRTKKTNQHFIIVLSAKPCCNGQTTYQYWFSKSNLSNTSFIFLSVIFLHFLLVKQKYAIVSRWSRGQQMVANWRSFLSVRYFEPATIRFKCPDVYRLNTIVLGLPITPYTIAPSFFRRACTDSCFGDKMCRLCRNSFAPFRYELYLFWSLLRSYSHWLIKSHRCHSSTPETFWVFE